MTVADLTPDALAKLEAKLVADLEVVRKVRALLEEHQAGQAGSVGAGGAGNLPSPAVPSVLPVVADPPSPAPAVQAAPYQAPAPTKSYSQWVLDGLRLMSPEGFVLGQLKDAL